MNLFNSAVSLSESTWDSEYFGVRSARAVLHSPLNESEWFALKVKLNKYEFVSIVNENSESKNSILLGQETTSFLIDINIQFEKQIDARYETKGNITVHQGLKKNNQILDLTNFQYSKFREDPYFSTRGGENVYREWVLNSFGKMDKYFALSENKANEIDGFVLYSYNNDKCLIELIAVKKDQKSNGIGSKLIKVVEYEATKKNISTLKVGTQLKNVEAINFYNKLGFKQIECHQVYHLWNIRE